MRARVQGDIERVFPDAVVTTTPDADYRFRAALPREVVSKAIAEQIKRIGYPNFKSSVKEADRHDACMAVWGFMHQLKIDRARR